MVRFEFSIKLFFETQWQYVSALYIVTSDANHLHQQSKKRGITAPLILTNYINAYDSTSSLVTTLLPSESLTRNWLIPRCT